MRPGYATCITAPLLVILAAAVQGQIGQIADCDYRDTFETDPVGQGPRACWYATSNLGTSFVTDQIHAPNTNGDTHAFMVRDASDPRFTFSAGAEACFDGRGATIQYDVMLQSLAQEVRIGFTPTATSDTVYLKITATTGVPTLTVGAATAALDAALVPNEWVHVQSRIECNAGASNDDVWLSITNEWGAGLATPYAVPINDVVALNDQTLTSSHANWNAWGIESAPGGPRVYLDNLEWYRVGTEAEGHIPTGGTLDPSNPDWGAAASNVDSAVDMDGRAPQVAVNDLGHIALTYYEDKAGTDVNDCKLAISKDNGATWYIKKRLSFTTSQNFATCDVRWIDADSLVVASCGGVWLSNNGGIAFDIKRSGSCSTTSSNHGLLVLDANTWVKFYRSSGGTSNFLYTTNGGSTFTLVAVVADYYMPSSTGVTGSFVFYKTVSGGSYLCRTVDWFVTITCGAQEMWPASAGTWLYASSAASNGPAYDHGVICAAGRWSATNSLAGSGGDVGLSCTYDFGGSWVRSTVRPTSPGSHNDASYHVLDGVPTMLYQVAGQTSNQAFLGRYSTTSNEWAWRLIGQVIGGAAAMGSPILHNGQIYLPASISPTTSSATENAFVLRGEPFQANAPLSYRFNDNPYFCSERGAERFGYNYKEGVTWSGDDGKIAGGSEIGAAYEFIGDASNFDYLAKTVPASFGAKTFFQIEADVEGTDSVFRVAYSFVNTASYDLGAPNHFLNGPDDAGANAKGDGLDEEAFEEYVEVRFLEVENDWNIAVYHVSQANDVEDRTKIGQSKLADDPNSPFTYVLILNTLDDYVSVRHGDGTQVGSGIHDDLNVTLPTFFHGLPLYSQWFVGYATDNAINRDAATWLDNKDETFASTCIYLLEAYDPATGLAIGEPACIGNCGAAGPVLVGSPNGTIPEGTAPHGGQGRDDSTAPGGIFDGFGLSSDSQFLFGFAIMVGFLLVARTKFSMDPHTILIVCGVMWIAFVAFGLWKMWTLIAAGVIGIVVLSKRIAGSLGG